MKRQNDIAWLPLNSLRAFAAVHETGSVGAAADELRVTHGAISQHLRGLEDRLQRKLFTRSGTRLVMLPEAADLADNLVRNFRAMAGDIDRFRRDDNILNITVTPHFAQHWLLPRLGEFLQRHPEIDLRINTDATVHDLEQGDFDAAVRHGDGNWPGLSCERLLEGWDAVVAAPSVLESISIQTPRDLTKLPWILDEDRDIEMSRWFDDHGIAHRAHTRITRLPSALTLVAALDGYGVAWLPHVYAAPYLASKRLVQLFGDDLWSAGNTRHYYLCWAEGRSRPGFRTFRQWIRQQISE
ncbi:LysR substrate-binding domain-containing protein [Paracoccus methylarcula]|uniref:LysR family transcriptional regulator n=1 Tax=Paracoccus methylarcula TaxID=72022 RepID=A0A3R7LKJ7_9RHOB|nr:LysR substrate-binding domain-containing protein [Paracoccus methylarcula]RNF34994.1 LysR family transcriptional regulator [Paracoccus methylarcula]